MSAFDSHFVEQYRELGVDNCSIRSCNGVVIHIISQLWGVCGEISC